MLAPNPATLVPKGRQLALNTAGNGKSEMGLVMKKKYAARLEFPLSCPKMDYTQPRFDRIDNRVFCDPPTSQGKALRIWCESPDLPLPLRGSPTCSLALACWRRPGFVHLFACADELDALVSQLQTARRLGTGNHFAISGILLFFIVPLSVPSLAPQPCSLIAFQAHGFMLRNWKPVCKPETP